MKKSLYLFFGMTLLSRGILACNFVYIQDPNDPSFPNNNCAKYVNQTMIHWDTGPADGFQIFFAKGDKASTKMTIYPANDLNQPHDCPYDHEDGAGNRFYKCRCPASGVTIQVGCPDDPGATLGGSGQVPIACAPCGMY